MHDEVETLKKIVYCLKNANNTVLEAYATIASCAVVKEGIYDIDTLELLSDQLNDEVTEIQEFIDELETYNDDEE